MRAFTNDLEVRSTWSKPTTRSTILKLMKTKTTKEQQEKIREKQIRQERNERRGRRRRGVSERRGWGHIEIEKEEGGRHTTFLCVFILLFDF